MKRLAIYTPACNISVAMSDLEYNYVTEAFLSNERFYIDDAEGVRYWLNTATISVITVSEEPA